MKKFILKIITVIMIGVLLAMYVKYQVWFIKITWEMLIIKFKIGVAFLLLFALIILGMLFASYIDSLINRKK